MTEGLARDLECFEFGDGFVNGILATTGDEDMIIWVLGAELFGNFIADALVGACDEGDGGVGTHDDERFVVEQLFLGGIECEVVDEGGGK